MRVLMLPSWYATDDKPWRGTFFQDQALSLIRHGLEVDLAFVERKSFPRLTPAAASTDIVIVSAEEHPRLRGAAMLVAAPTFAAPVVA